LAIPTQGISAVNFSGIAVKFRSVFLHVQRADDYSRQPSAAAISGSLQVAFEMRQKAQFLKLRQRVFAHMPIKCTKYCIAHKMIIDA
jgi:hypothetical protein